MINQELSTGIGPLFQAHRKTDPASSEFADKRITEMGVRAKQCLEVLEVLGRWSEVSSKYLAEVGHLDRYMVARRLPDLEKSKLAKCERKNLRFCPACKQNCEWWTITDKGRRFLNERKKL